MAQKPYIAFEQPIAAKEFPRIPRSSYERVFPPLGRPEIYETVSPHLPPLCNKYSVRSPTYKRSTRAYIPKSRPSFICKTRFPASSGVKVADTSQGALTEQHVKVEEDPGAASMYTQLPHIHMQDFHVCKFVHKRAFNHMFYVSELNPCISYCARRIKHV